MKVMVTGAFGNVGTSTVEGLARQGHTVRCFDLKSKANVRAARKLKGQTEVIWGDLRHRQDLARAVCDQEVVIHLAFIIPKLSATGFESEDHPDWAREINIGGTRNLLETMKAQPRPPRLVFASSYHIYGRTHDQPPPRTVLDPVQPIEHYACHKVECEELIRSSGLEWAILRLAASLPIAMKLDPAMFDIPLDNRMEYVHTRDAGLAFANAAGSPDVWGRILLIGGGPRCQYLYREITERVLEGLGLGPLPEEAFSSTPFPTDWLDTAESQRLLQYQRHTLDAYIQDMVSHLGPRRVLVRAFRPLVRTVLLKQSPYYHEGKPGWVAVVMQGIKALRKKPMRVNMG
jgi:UDP-glucose 4-epimerase